MQVKKKRVYLLICMIILSLLFVIIAFNYKEQLLWNIDEWIQFYAYSFLGLFGDAVFVVVTYIGSGYIAYPLLFIITCFLLFQKRYWTSLLLVMNLIGVRQMNWLLKSAFERSRPELEHLVQVSSESFPSGHAMNSMAFFGFLTYLLYVRIQKIVRSGRWIWVSAAILIGIIGFSRIYLGVHYASDVLGGFLAGGTWLLFSVFLYTFIPNRERFNERGSESKLIQRKG